jgi:hypothetical protein
MPVDTRGLRHEHVSKRLRIELADGEIEDVRLLEVTVCEEPEPCCGITYDLIATNRSDGKREKGAIYWTGFADIVNFQVLGD